MLVMFRFKNFGPFKDEVMFDMRAVKAYKEHPYNLIANDSECPLLKVASIFGANASGKSNFIDAYEHFLYIVRESFYGKSKEGSASAISEAYYPFAFDDQSDQKDTEFEAVYQMNGFEYRYGFAYNAERIEYEWLYRMSLTSKRTSRILERGPVEKPLIETQGEGKSTVRLVEETSRIVSRARLIYSQVWVVFDKDDFQDFDEAVSLAEARGFRAAWSNQSFEYWIYLHFHYSDSALHRDAWAEKLSELLKKSHVCDKGYRKNDPDVFQFATTLGSLKAAVGNATRIEKSYKDEERPSRCDPCTKVHHLILELKPYLGDLL